MHRHEPARLQILEYSDCFVWSHVNMPEGLGMVGTDGQERYLGAAFAPNVLESFEISAVPGMVDLAPLMFEDEPPITSMMIAQHSGSPVLTRRECYLPSVMNETVPPLQFDDSSKAEVMSQIPHPPGHYRHSGPRQTPQSGLVKMVEVGVSQQNQVDRRQILDAHAGPLDSFQEEKPVCKVWVDQDIQVCELNKKRCMANPCHGDLSRPESGKDRLLMLTRAARQERFP